MLPNLPVYMCVVHYVYVQVDVLQGDADYGIPTIEWMCLHYYIGYSVIAGIHCEIAHLILDELQMN